MIVPILSILFAIAVGTGAYVLNEMLEREKIRLKWFAAFDGLPRGSLLFSWNAPLISLFFPSLVRFKEQKFLIQLDIWLREAGLLHFCRAEHFIIFILSLGLEIGFLFSVFFGFSFASFFWGFVLGGLYPWLWLFESRKERFLSIRQDLPLVIDLLAVSVSAGQDMMQALEKIVAVLPKRGLVEEIQKMLKELKIGKTRKEVLLSLKEKVPVPEMKTLISFLVQAIQLGTSMSPILIATAEQMRVQRFMEAEKMGIQAGQKILFPMIFCILPAVFITIFAPLLIRYWTGGFSLG